MCIAKLLALATLGKVLAKLMLKLLSVMLIGLYRKINGNICELRLKSMILSYIFIGSDLSQGCQSATMLVYLRASLFLDWYVIWK